MSNSVSHACHYSGCHLTPLTFTCAACNKRTACGSRASAGGAWVIVQLGLSQQRDSVSQDRFDCMTDNRLPNTECSSHVAVWPGALHNTSGHSHQLFCLRREPCPLVAFHHDAPQQHHMSAHTAYVSGRLLLVEATHNGLAGLPSKKARHTTAVNRDIQGPEHSNPIQTLAQPWQRAFPPGGLVQRGRNAKLGRQQLPVCNTDTRCQSVTDKRASHTRHTHVTHLLHAKATQMPKQYGQEFLSWDTV